MRPQPATAGPVIALAGNRVRCLELAAGRVAIFVRSGTVAASCRAAMISSWTILPQWTFVTSPGRRGRAAARRHRRNSRSWRCRASIARQTEEIAHTGYVDQRLTVETEPGFTVPAVLLLPTADASAHPAVIYIDLIGEDSLEEAAAENILLSYMNFVRTKHHHGFNDLILPGVLQDYDLPDFAYAASPRPVWIASPRRADTTLAAPSPDAEPASKGTPATLAEVQATYTPPGAPASVHVLLRSSSASFMETYGDWLE